MRRSDQLGSLELFSGADDQRGSGLLEAIDRILDKGLVINGDISLAVGGAELLSLRVNLVISSIETAKRYGIELPWEKWNGQTDGPESENGFAKNTFVPSIETGFSENARLPRNGKKHNRYAASRRNKIQGQNHRMNGRTSKKRPRLVSAEIE